MAARSWLAAGAGVLIALEVFSVLYLLPLTTLTISVEEAYRVVHLDRISLFAAVGAAVCVAVAAMIILALRKPFTRWGIANACALVVGSIALIFVCVSVLVSFGYISLYDEDPKNFSDAPNMVFELNLWGSALAPAGLISAAVYYFRRTWNVGTKSI